MQTHDANQSKQYKLASALPKVSEFTNNLALKNRWQDNDGNHDKPHGDPAVQAPCGKPSKNDGCKCAVPENHDRAKGRGSSQSMIQM